MEKEIVVPAGMLQAVRDAGRVTSWDSYSMVAAALRWLSENPIVPTDEEVVRLAIDDPRVYGTVAVRRVIARWQRIMFLAPDPTSPDKIKALQSRGPGSQ
jgi:hypothetical protein